MKPEKSTPRAKARRAKPDAHDERVTEDTVLELLERNRLTQYNPTLVARKLGCSTERSIALLRALAKRRAVQTSSSPIGEPLYAALLDSNSAGLQRIRERGDLRVDHNGALRHWELCMAARKS